MRARLVALALLAGAGCESPLVTMEHGAPHDFLHAASPRIAPGGVTFELHVSGQFEPGDRVEVDGVGLSTTFVTGAELVGIAGPYARGEVGIRVRRGELLSRAIVIEVDNSPPTLGFEGRYEVAEDDELLIELRPRDFDGDELRLGAFDLPPGATLELTRAQLRFSPDFIQGGRSWMPTVLVDDGIERVARTLEIAAIDTIQPPEPIVRASEDLGGSTRLRLDQRTDDYLDGPGYAGRVFEAVVTVPIRAADESPVPVRVQLHGLGARRPRVSGSSSEFRIAPHDPQNTYWWGYAEGLPGPPSGPARPYTARRVLHLLAWVLDHYPHADPNRVYVAGSSMGGAGAATLGVLWARHFAFARAWRGQLVPRNHRPARLRSLARRWGDPEAASSILAWDRMDLTRALLHEAEARGAFLETLHGKDDSTIHFGAVSEPSPLTGLSYYDVVQADGLGHYAVWDEGGHGSADPVLGGGWWDGGWDLATDPESSLRRDRAFPAFSRASSDRDPGTGRGNGRRARDDDAGFAGRVAVPGDTGWDGDVAGALNRFLRWDAAGILDTVDAFEVPLRYVDGEGQAPPREGYPTRGDRFEGGHPVRTDVTPRRTQAFRLRPGERVRWELAEQRGEARASADGSVTIVDAALDTSWELLRIERLGSLAR